MRSERFRGIVLRRTNLAEADRLVILITPSGKKKVVARGVRKMTSRKAGALELFNVVDVQVSTSARSWPIIQEVTVVTAFPSLREDFNRVSHAYWAGELVDRLVHEEAEENSLFEALYKYLVHLDSAHDSLDIHAFELVALRELGWQPELGSCAQCHAALSGDQLAWSDELGGVIGQDCCNWPAATRTISQNAVKVLRLLTEKGYDVTEGVEIPASVVAEVAAILHGYLESISERRFRSPALFKEMGTGVSDLD